MLQGKLATPEHYDALVAKLRQEGELVLDTWNGGATAGDWAADVVREPRQAIEQFVFDGVVYSLELTGFEGVRHETYGPIVESIGYFPNHDQQVRLGVSERLRRTCYLELG